MTKNEIYVKALLQRVVTAAEGVKAQLLAERDKGVTESGRDYLDAKAQGAAEVIKVLRAFSEWETR